MSSITSLSPTSAAFPPVNTHAHGHKHGSQMDSADAPTGAVQNLFGSLLQTAEKVIGLQSSPAAAAIAAGTAAVSARAPPRIAGTVTNSSPTQSAGTPSATYGSSSRKIAGNANGWNQNKRPRLIVDVRRSHG